MCSRSCTNASGKQAHSTELGTLLHNYFISNINTEHQHFNTFTDNS